jgi:putative MFS transporter
MNNLDHNRVGNFSNIINRIERLPISRLHYKLLFIHGFGWFFDAMDVGIITFVIVAIAPEWGLTTSQLGLVASSGFLGMFVGAILAGIIADYLGRKSVFQITLLIFSIATLLCAFSWNLTSLLVFRFLVGFGLGGELPVVSSLFSEFVPSKFRGRFIVYLESFWAYGWLIASVIAFLIIPQFGWRIAFIIGAIPALYVWVIRKKLPESPLWYASKGRNKEAHEIMRKLEVETEIYTGSSLPAVTENTISNNKYVKSTFKELWVKSFRKRTISVWILWFGLVFGYYGIFVWLPSILVKSGFSMVNSFIYVIIITLAQIPGYFSAAYLIERIGRKPIITGFLIMSALMAYLFSQATSVTGILIFASLMSFFNLGAWGGVYTYTAELYPTRSRATGAGSAAAFGRIGGIIAPYLVGLLMPSIGTKGVMILNSSFLIMAALSIGLFGVETKGKILD